MTKSISIELENRPGALATFGEVLGKAGISVEGGGVWLVNGRAIGHFLFHDGIAARAALEAAGIRVLGIHDVLVQRLDQDRPGQLGEIGRHMADAGVNIEAMYSDHDNQLILVVDDRERGAEVSAQWMSQRM